MRRTSLLLTTTIASLMLSLQGFSQYLSEDFEEGLLPTGWSEQRITGTKYHWEYENGGYTSQPGEPITRSPYPAHGGSFNALFYYESETHAKIKLITKSIDLSGAGKPLLIFWHAQMANSDWGSEVNDELKVYYRKSSTSSWVQIGNYPYKTPDLSPWVRDSIQIPDNAHDASTTGFQIAFEAYTNYGYGVCLDDISLEERSIINKNVSDISVKQASTSYVSTGTMYNPILRVDLKTIGNTGYLILDSIAFRSQNTNNSDLLANGVKIFATRDTVFSALKQLGSNSNFSSNKVSFNNINDTLYTGYNYVWLTYDISTSATIGDLLDASIDANSIKIRTIVGTTTTTAKYPTSSVYPTGSRTIYESIFTDDFESTKGWTLTGEWQIAAPTGKGGESYGNPDPTSAYSGLKVLGTDLTGLGSYLGDYEPYITEASAYVATSPLINCFYYKDINLSYQRWLNHDNTDVSVIEVSGDSAQTWHQVWQNSGISRDKAWSKAEVSLAAYANRMKNVSVRYRLKYTDGSWNFSGWNIDDFILSGDFVNKDIGVTSMIAPSNNCGMSATETVSVRVKNYGYDALNYGAPIRYSFDNGLTYKDDTITTAIPQGDSILFTFTPKVDLSVPGIYPVIVTIADTLDEEKGNDTLRTTLYSLPTYTMPYTSSFEGDSSFWLTGGLKNIWSRGMPSGSTITSAAVGQKAWETDTVNYYQANDSSWVESPCMNLSGLLHPVVELKLFTETEASHDGAALYYSIDDGAHWSIVPKHTDTFNWSWYNNTSVAALGSAGWGGSTGNWVTKKQLLPNALIGQSSVKFRMLFMSDNATEYDGVAFDQFKLYETPADIGAISIDNIVDSCQYIVPKKPLVSVKNYGMVPMKTGDTLIVGLTVSTKPAVIDTFVLTSNFNAGDTLQVYFTKPIDLSTAGDFVLKAYTLSEINPYLYASVCNDTMSTALSVHIGTNPVINLPVGISSAHPDTIELSPVYNADWSYEWEGGSIMRLFDVPAAGTYSVTVTDNITSCATYDSVIITQLTPNIAIDSIVSPYSACVWPNKMKLNVRLNNVGSDTLRTGDTIFVAYKRNSGAIINDTLDISGRYDPATTLEFAFNDSLDMTLNTNDTLKVWFSYIDDNIQTNDTIYRIIHEWGNPTPDLGTDTALSAGNYTISAGSGYVSYLWNDASTDTALITEVSGTFSVMVTDTNNCSATDTIKVTLSTIDVTIDSIPAPVTSCAGYSASQLMLTIRNSGNDTLFVGDTIYTYYTLGSNPVVADTLKLTATLYPDSLVDFSFTHTENLTNDTTYVYTAWVKTSGDLRPYNDTLQKSIVTYGNPTISLGTSPLIINAMQYVLDPGAGFDHYSWATGDTTQTYTVTKLMDTYSVTVTDSNNCQANSSVTLILYAKDFGIDTVLSPVNDCEPTSSNALTVRITNYGNANVSSGNVFLFCELNGETLADTLQITSTWGGGSYKDFTFSSNPNYSSTGVNNLTIYLKYSGDLIPSNDTITSSVTYYGFPNINFGETNDTLNTSLPYVLEPGEAYTSYLWQDNSTENYYIVNSSGNYSVNIVDTNGCAGYDSLYINQLTTNMSIDSIYLPANSCYLTNSEAVKYRVRNAGNTTLEIGDVFEATCTINGSSVSEWEVIDVPIGKGESREFTFTNFFDFSKDTTYTVHVNASLSGDEYSNDNTISKTVKHLVLPTIDLGEDTIEVLLPYTLTASSGFDSYQWQDNSTNQSIVIISTGLYKVTATDSIACLASDSIQIIGLTQDLGLTASTSPVSNCQNTATQNIKVTIHNYGTYPIPADSILHLGYQINNGTWVTENYTLTSILQSGAEIDHTFATSFGMGTSGNYSFKFYVSRKTDIDRSNDTITQSTEVYALPAIDLGGVNDTLSTLLPYTLDAGSGYNSYNWNGSGSGTSTKAITTAGTYSVTVTDANSCSDRDTVVIVELIKDIAITAFSAPSDSLCDASVPRTVSLSFKNNGTYNIPASSFSIAYVVNSGDPVIETYTFTGPFKSDSVINYNFTTPLYLSEGSNDIRVYIDLAGDAESSNDYIDRTIQQFPAASVELGGTNDSLTALLPATVDAGSGFANYTWNTSAVSQSIIVSTGGTYKVTVTDDNKCQASDSLVVVALVKDISVVSLLHPVDSCYITSNERISVLIRNTGTYNIPSGTITVKYNINGGSYVSESHVLTAPLNVGEELTHTFTTSVNFPSGSYTIKSLATLSGDQVTSNDTLTSSINKYTYPTPYIGPAINIVDLPYTISCSTSYASYTWNDNSNASTLIASTEGLYSLTVTDANGCSGTTSSQITSAYVDFAIASLIMPNDGCSSGNDQVEIQIINNGNSSISNGTLDLHYTLNGSTPVNESYNISSAWLPSATLNYAFSQLIDLTTAGSYNLKVYLNISADNIKTNDSLTTNVTSLGYPIIDFGTINDTLSGTSPYSISPGSGFSSYNWQDGSSASTYNVTATGWYTVEVENSNNCPASDSVYVWLLTSNNELEEEGNLTLFPVPVTSTLKVHLMAPNTNAIQIEAVNLQGQIIYSKALKGQTEYLEEIDMNGQPAGMYYFRVISNEKPKLYKFIKQ
jgi:hypothetical protein